MAAASAAAFAAAVVAVAAAIVSAVVAGVALPFEEQEVVLKGFLDWVDLGVAVALRRASYHFVPGVLLGGLAHPGRQPEQAAPSAGIFCWRCAVRWIYALSILLSSSPEMIG
eukprot:CAMPEP_0206448068 /NCGR_PEP_ID=MMETSP0324_2-20121206/17214_1 /ASSEMBLY_ACC=CAM_ASM_000836 /TAXON_ID=2866 /ORGANISM="Crypthecodinium cohnii, Strain Seligo" /LENGTH=111 /DNA_ID=CAMNT_0053917065 /DNA_START=347 /DNA_END=683 /DNA_ORIENTATION=-